MEDVPSDPPDEEFPGLSERSPRRKRRSRRRRGTPQPDVGIFSKTACSEPSFRVYDRVRSIVPSSLPSQLNARPVTLPAVQSAAAQLPAVQSAIPSPVTPPLQSSPPPVGQSLASLPVVQWPLAQLSAHSFIQPPSSLFHSEQGTHFTTTSAGSLKLATSETVTPSRASPEAGCRSPANSGPLEAKTPAPAAPPENSPEQSRLSAPPESSSEFTRPPPSSECIGEHFQPSEDCIPLLLPESSHCAAQSQPVSTLAEVCVPAASVSVSAGGSKEPVQPHASSAGGPGGPSQHILMSADGPGKSVQPSPAELFPAPAASSPPPSGPAAVVRSGPAPASSTPRPSSCLVHAPAQLLPRPCLALRLPYCHGTQLILFRLASAGRFLGL
ncbi:unnamed protein product [Oreochromis niloticus]|nr:unnamed protein product [Mustela putorius furo]